MKYAILSDLELLTPELTQEILACADINTLRKIAYFTQGTATRPTHGAEEKAAEYKFFENSALECGEGFFAICYLPEELEAKLFDRLPAKLKECQYKPRIRIQLLQNYQLFPHIDNNRKTSLFTMVTDNAIDTVFWDVTEPHEFLEGHIPNSDLIEERVRIKFKKNETWIFDNDTIHGTTESSPDLRISINYGYFHLSTKELLQLTLD